ncbi:MAG: recombinase [Spirulina sp. DLM2.Bin59]|nr:MAG: recombinase [Spirulina sp. DLM2.Bin59]
MLHTKKHLKQQNFQDVIVSSGNEYTGYADILALYKSKAQDCPTEVQLNLQHQKFLMIQFNDPVTGKLTIESSGEQFTKGGIINAVRKCWLIDHALKSFDHDDNFLAWYNQNILSETKANTQIKTYGEIFEELETAYFSGTHKNTKRKRSKDSVNDVHSFESFYGKVFKLFPDWNACPSISDFKCVVENLALGTKTAKDAGSILKKIADLSHDSKQLTEYLSSVDFKQKIFAEKQSIDYQTFLQWYQSTKSKILASRNHSHQESGLAWLWICAMGVVYGLRPSEIAAAQNINTAFTIDRVTFPPITDTKNHDKLLYLGEFTFNGCSIKTGVRICRPLASYQAMTELEIEQFPGMPKIKAKEAQSISNSYINFLNRNHCPVTQAYAFRHLANQLGELNGIPQEIRARSLGHSVSVNESVYKKRLNLKTTVNLLKNHSKQPLPLAMGIQALHNLGVDTDDQSVQLILKVLYQISE